MKSNRVKPHDGSFEQSALQSSQTEAEMIAVEEKAEVVTVLAHPAAPHQDRCALMSSSCGEDEGHAAATACPSYLGCEHCANALHELANLMTGVLTNAQVVGWKLPPYSHLKRPIRELERNAQRGGELLKSLMQRCAARG